MLPNGLESTLEECQSHVKLNSSPGQRPDPPRSIPGQTFVNQILSTSNTPLRCPTQRESIYVFLSLQL